MTIIRSYFMPSSELGIALNRPLDAILAGKSKRERAAAARIFWRMLTQLKLVPSTAQLLTIGPAVAADGESGVAVCYSIPEPQNG